MARIYDVVCPECGAILQWCKYDPPLEECDDCSAKLISDELDDEGNPKWRDDVSIFGVWSTSSQILRKSLEIKKGKA